MPRKEGSKKIEKPESKSQSSESQNSQFTINVDNQNTTSEKDLAKELNNAFSSISSIYNSMEKKIDVDLVNKLMNFSSQESNNKV